jgi:hypothetical protein
VRFEVLAAVNIEIWVVINVKSYNLVHTDVSEEHAANFFKVLEPEEMEAAELRPHVDRTNNLLVTRRFGVPHFTLSFSLNIKLLRDRLCGLVVRVPGC